MLIEPGEDPGLMDGKEIAARLGEVAHDPEQPWDKLTLWAGVAAARLLEYQGKLAEAGLLTYRGAERRAHPREKP